MVVVVVVVVAVVVVVVVDVVVVVVVAVAVARCFVGTHARRARAPNTPANTDSFGARARAARARTYTEGRFGSPQTNQKTMVFTMFLQQARR